MSNFNRRQFMKISALSALGFAVAPTLRFGSSAATLLGQDALAAAAPADGHTLVYVFCRGAMDPLAFFPPMNGSGTLRTKYELYRPNIKFDANPLNIAAPPGQLGINVHLNPIKKLIEDGDMEVILGVGSVNETLSHFNQMDYIEGGNSKRRIGEGLFQRLSQVKGWESTTALVAAEPTIPRSLNGGKKFVFQYSNPDALAGLGLADVKLGVSSAERLMNNFLSYGPAREKARALASANQEVYDLVKNVNRSSFASMPLNELAEAVRLLKAGVSPRVMSVSLMGWDFHSNLARRFADDNGAVRKFATSLAGFAAELKAMGRWENTTVVVMSEFGRRITENGALGSDHGRGGMMILMGGKVRGGRVVKMASFEERLLASYHASDRAQRNLEVDFDYRTVLEEIFRKRFAVNPQDTLNTIFEDTVAGIDPVTGSKYNFFT